MQMSTGSGWQDQLGESLRVSVEGEDVGWRNVVAQVPPSLPVSVKRPIEELELVWKTEKKKEN